MSLARLALDGSTVFAILLNEPEAVRCRATMRAADRIIMSAASLTELCVVAAGKDVSGPVETLLGRVRPEIVPLTEIRARRIIVGIDIDHVSSKLDLPRSKFHPPAS